MSEKASKGRFLKREKLQNHSNEGKGKEKKKERGEGKEEMKKKGMVAHLVFIMATLGLWPKKLLDGKGPFGGNVFKYAARFFVGVFVADRGISFALRAQVILL